MPSRLKAIRTAIETHVNTAFSNPTIFNEPILIDDQPNDQFPIAMILFKEEEPERLDFKQERRRVTGQALIAILTTPGDTAEAARESMDVQLQGVRDAIFADPYLTASVDDVRVAAAETISGTADAYVYGEIEIITEEVY